MGFLVGTFILAALKFFVVPVLLGGKFYFLIVNFLRQAVWFIGSLLQALIDGFWFITHIL